MDGLGVDEAADDGFCFKKRTDSESLVAFSSEDLTAAMQLDGVVAKCDDEGRNKKEADAFHDNRKVSGMRKERKHGICRAVEWRG